MTGWHEGLLAPMDTETTSPQPLEARLVTACAGTVNGATGEQHLRSWLVNPGVDTPAEATAIHKITTEKAQAEGIDPTQALEQITATLYDAWDQGAAVVGHNIVYDLTVLSSEATRHGQTFEVRGPVVDTLVLDKQVLPRLRGSGQRQLAPTAARYRVSLDGAHDATFDALAAARIAWRICQEHPRIAAMTPAELHEAQVVWATEQTASLADFFRRKAAEHPAGSEDRTQLLAKAAGCDGTWPICATTTASATG